MLSACKRRVVLEIVANVPLLNFPSTLHSSKVNALGDAGGIHNRNSRLMQLLKNLL